MALSPVQQTNVSLPNARVLPLGEDGTFTLPWRRFFEQMFIAGGGSTSNATTANQIISTVNTNSAAADAAYTLAQKAETDAQSALSELSSSQQLSFLGLIGPDPAPVDNNLIALTFLGLAGLDRF